MTPAEEAGPALDLAGVDCGGKLVSFSPIDGKPIGRVTVGDPDTAARVRPTPSCAGALSRHRAVENSCGCSASGCVRRSRCWQS